MFISPPFLRYATGVLALSISCAAISEESNLVSCDMVKGEKVFHKCSACHSNDNTGEHGIVGPNLYNIVNRQVGKVAGYKFSAALRKTEDTWTYELLDNFIKRPMDVYPRTRMAFSGISKLRDRKNLICFLSRNNTSNN